MKKVLLLLPVLGILFMSGCSSTIDGVKQDSSNAWKKTKQTIHEATAD